MIWRSSFNSRFAVIADFLTAVLGFLVSYSIWSLLYMHYSPTFPKPAPVSLTFIIWAVVSGYIYVFLFKANKAYSYQRFTSLSTEYSIVLRVAAIGSLLSLAAAFFLNLTSLRRTFFILLFFDVFILYILQKSLLYYFAQQVRKAGRNRRRVLVVGTGERTEQFLSVVKSNFSWGLDVVGLLSADPDMLNKEIKGIPVIGSFSQIEEIIKTVNPEEVIITISTKKFEQIRDILESCDKVGMNVRLYSDFFGHITKRVQVDNVFGLNLISFGFNEQSEFELFLKRIFDIIFSLLFIFLLSPILLTIALVIYFQDGRPVLYRWQVMGRNRKPVTSWKFRTMVRNADEVKEKLLTNNEMTGPMFKMTDDPRILPFGRFLRKFSLDELPQFFSVLKGDLSLVGPRPPLQTEFREFDLWHRRKLSVKPGMTCLWQVSGRNGINNFDDWARLDLEYIDNWSLWLDFKILFKTIPAVIRGTGK